MKPKSARFGYRDWTAGRGRREQRRDRRSGRRSCTARGSDRRRVCAASRRPAASMRAAGWAMNNMEAVAYLCAEQPLHLAEDDDAQEALDRKPRALRRAPPKRRRDVLCRRLGRRCSPKAPSLRPTGPVRTGARRLLRRDRGRLPRPSRRHAPRRRRRRASSARGWLGRLRAPPASAFRAARRSRSTILNARGRIARGVSKLRVASRPATARAGRRCSALLAARPRRAPRKKGKRTWRLSRRPEMRTRCCEWRARGLQLEDRGAARRSRPGCGAPRACSTRCCSRRRIDLIRAVRATGADRPRLGRRRRRLVVLAMTLPRIESGDRRPRSPARWARPRRAARHRARSAPRLSPSPVRRAHARRARAATGTDSRARLRRALAILGDAPNRRRAPRRATCCASNDAALRRWTYDYWQTIRRLNRRAVHPIRRRTKWKPRHDRLSATACA